MQETKLQNNNTGSKYVYLLFFFAFLSGLFYPIVTGNSPDKALTGVLILWVGLIGILLIFKGAKDEEKKLKYLIMGTITVIADLVFIFAATGMFG